jgi:hypothetical protein
MRDQDMTRVRVVDRGEVVATAPMPACDEVAVGTHPADMRFTRRRVLFGPGGIFLYLLFGFCLIGGYFAIPLPASSGKLDLKVALYLAVNASATVALAFGIWRYRPRRSYRGCFSYSTS